MTANALYELFLDRLEDPFDHDCKPEPYVPVVRGERFDYAAIWPTFWRCHICGEPMYGVPK